mmetsp:Transcript_13215/g.23714  ORF Transcript_13215/g.23714 Transcript_13215/m.23714 type:complete len:115 (-) Transcript_13215:1599-1943(-)
MGWAPLALSTSTGTRATPGPAVKGTFWQGKISLCFLGQVFGTFHLPSPHPSPPYMCPQWLASCPYSYVTPHSHYISNSYPDPDNSPNLSCLEYETGSSKFSIFSATFMYHFTSA